MRNQILLEQSGLKKKLQTDKEEKSRSLSNEKLAAGVQTLFKKKTSSLMSWKLPEMKKRKAKALENFGSKSGMNMNILKSNIFMAGICEPGTREILEFSLLTRGTMLFRYLGIPLAVERLKVVHFEELVENIRAYANCWSSNTLSYAGRTELVQSVLQGVECFWLSILPIPAVIHSKIIRSCRSFLWGSTNPSVAWSTLCFPKSGGLGLRDFQSWDHALLAKTLWNIQGDKDTL
ncbi:hypothetical protein DH2020_046465 [Rehmannia glutinosa]|uniref:Uncharacterized protein n=1 Tax=Rehmannia glutinosa TaxID=99300 RepID=A0ABR0UBD3_REHGL